MRIKSTNLSALADAEEVTRALHAYTLIEPILSSDTIDRSKIVGTRSTINSAPTACGLVVMKISCTVSPGHPDVCTDSKGKRQRVLPTAQRTPDVNKKPKSVPKSDKGKQGPGKAGSGAIPVMQTGKKTTTAKTAQVSDTSNCNKKHSTIPASPNVSKTSKAHQRDKKEQNEPRTARVKARVVVQAVETNTAKTKACADVSQKQPPITQRAPKASKKIKGPPNLDIKKQSAPPNKQSAIDISIGKKKGKKTKGKGKRQSTVP